MQPSEFKKYLIDAVVAEARAAPDAAGRAALEWLASRLDGLGLDDEYLEKARLAHNEQPDAAQHREALKTAVSEYRTYDDAQQLPTVFLIDLVNASHPEEGFV